MLLFAASTIAFLAMWLLWRTNVRLPGIDTPFELIPPSSQTFWLVLAAATSLASLLGIVSNTILGWRKEQRESRAEALERRRQELEIQKLQLELEREQAAARQGHSPKGSDQPATAPPSPEDGERRRLSDRWAELDRGYRQLSRLLAAVDKDLGQALEAERRLVLQEHRDELAAQREAVAAELAEVERKVADMETAGEAGP